MPITNKTASNFELNVIKIGVHTFQLVKGDRFESNGSYFHYIPSTAENKGKGKHDRWTGRRDSLSAKKYEKDVLRADNIELIKDVPLSSSEPADSEYNIANRLRTWEVKYAYKMELPKNENLVLLQIELGGRFGEEDKHQWVFKTEELPVKRVTAENYFLENHNPVDYKSQIPKKDLNNVRVRSNDNYYVLCLMDDYNDMEVLLFNYVEKAVNDKIQSGHDIVRRQTNNLNKFLLLKTKQGY